MPTDKTIRLGNPSFVWRFGQDRRLNMITQYAHLPGARLLDVGCGIGTYVLKLQAGGARAFGVDVDLERLGRAYHEKGLETVSLAASEVLPFPTNSFDAVLLHEVVEHVDDDRETICEAQRVTSSGGVVIVFAPNRLYPFETHGAFFGGHYIFGNIPLVGYLPNGIRRRVAPHVRAYTVGSLRDLFRGLPGEFVTHTQIYPGYDQVAYRRPTFARVLRRVTYALESTPLRNLGLSHFLVWRKK